MTFSQDIKEKLKINLIALDRLKIDKLIQDILKKERYPEIINNVVYPVMKEIGELWENGDIALSQVYMSGKIIQDSIKKYFPKQKLTKLKQVKIGIANLEDYHPLGMKLIQTYLENFGIELIVYPVGITIKNLLSKIMHDNLEILLISTLMLRSALKIKNLTQAIREKNLNIKVIVGGAPFNFDDSLWKKVGADAVGVN
ncbi:MAG: cobalamin B12-binding domain-containing protein, partial [Promethearchaeia archaeon]